MLLVLLRREPPDSDFAMARKRGLIPSPEDQSPGHTLKLPKLHDVDPSRGSKEAIQLVEAGRPMLGTTDQHQNLTRSKTTDVSVNIEDLPPEVLVRILIHVDYTHSTFASLTLVNRHFNDLIKANNHQLHDAIVRFQYWQARILFPNTYATVTSPSGYLNALQLM